MTESRPPSTWTLPEQEASLTPQGKLYYGAIDVLAWPIGIAAACLALPLLALMVIGVVEYPDDGGPYSYGE